MIENRQTYRLDVSKIKTLKDARNVFDLIKLVGYYDPKDPEDEYYHLREYFTILEEPQELTFSRPRKSIEELSQEFNDKIDELIETTKEKFEYSKVVAEKRYKYEFDKIFERFEYAKDRGHFPPKLTFTVGDRLSVNSGSYFETSFIIRQGKNHEGYYTIGNQRFLKYYMPDKPNFVSRFFMDKLLGVVWVDEKND